MLNFMYCIQVENINFDQKNKLDVTIIQNNNKKIILELLPETSLFSENYQSLSYDEHTGNLIDNSKYHLECFYTSRGDNYYIIANICNEEYKIDMKSIQIILRLEEQTYSINSDISGYNVELVDMSSVGQHLRHCKVHNKLDKDYYNITQIQDVQRIQNKFKNKRKLSLTRPKVRVIELHVLSDKSYFDTLGSINAVESKVITYIAMVNDVYRSTLWNDNYEIHVLLVGQSIFNTGDPYTVKPYESNANEVDSGELLDSVIAYSKTVSYNFDHITLLSSLDFDDGTIGLAGLGRMCTLSSASVNQMLAFPSPNFDTENYLTITHEIGHSLSMLHDGDAGASCDNSQYIMSPFTQSSLPNTFSQCSIDILDSFFASSQSLCLDNATPLFSEAVCGDGLVTFPDEDCDCIDRTNCDPCCDVNTCRLKSTSTCSSVANHPLLDWSCCDPSTCQAYTSNNVVCRTSENECDTQEVCTPGNPVCPVNTVTKLGQACTASTGDSGNCYNNICISQGESCKALEAFYVGSFQASSLCGPVQCDTKLCLDDQTCYNFPGATEGEALPEPDGIKCGVNKQCDDGVCKTSTQIIEPEFIATGFWDECSCNGTNLQTFDNNNVKCINILTGNEISMNYCLTFGFWGLNEIIGRPCCPDIPFITQAPVPTITTSSPTPGDGDSLGHKNYPNLVIFITLCFIFYFQM